MVTDLPKKDYIITKIILAIGLIPFTFYMLQTEILKGSLLETLIGIDVLHLIFSVMSFFLTISILSLSISFTQINKSDKKAFFKIFNWFFDVGVFLSAVIFVLASLGIMAVKLGTAMRTNLIEVINQNIIPITFLILLLAVIFIYNKYFKSKTK